MTLDRDWEDQFMKDLHVFIKACLKDECKTGSLTKTQMIDWFKSQVIYVIGDFKVENY